MPEFHLPKLFYPIAPEVHPLMQEIEDEALERWARFLGLHARHRTFKKLQRSRFPGLLGRSHPTVSKEKLRVAVDYIIWNFSWDDQIDVGDVPPEWVRQQNEMAAAVLQGATPYHDAPPLLWMLASIRAELAGRMPAAWMERFARACQTYFDGTVWEAQTRVNRICHDVETYIQLRRLSIGTYPIFTQIEAAEGFLMPEEVLAHPALQALVEAATDVIGWANDLFSVEQELKDDFHPNLVFSLQKQQGLTLQEAIYAAVEMHDNAMRRFLALEKDLPSFGESQEQVKRFVACVRRCIRANVDWSIMTGRYQESEPEHEAAVELVRAA